MTRQLAPSRNSNPLEHIIAGSGISCEIGFPSGRIERFGPGDPQFTIRFKNRRPLRRGFDEFAFADA